ncbi:hypothetical protein UPYG_G00318370 [Umbra pygmaea]|uniref:Uncharacterized protein n=1 Tax=Umbra pygmaea TaxID=75934 RepID=A0ABD0WHD3_UMBPY
MQMMVSHFSIIGGTSMEMRVLRMRSCALTNELASSVNWAGKMIKEQLRNLPYSIQYFPLPVPPLMYSIAYILYSVVFLFCLRCFDIADGCGKSFLI